MHGEVTIAALFFLLDLLTFLNGTEYNIYS
jgi:hypothetical protein